MAVSVHMDRTINTEPTSSPAAARAAVIDCRRRSMQAGVDHARFFRSTAHTQRVEATLSILRKFFPNIHTMYVNQRGNRGDPFTVIKLQVSSFPTVSYAAKTQLYYQPLQELGVEIVTSCRTNSLLYRIR